MTRGERAGPRLGDTLSPSRRSRPASRAGGGTRSTLSAAPPRGHTGVHDLDRVTERVSVLPLVQAVELLQARAIVEPPFRQGHSELVIPGRHSGNRDPSRSRRRSRRHRRDAAPRGLGGELVEIPVQPRLVEPPFDHEDRAHLVVAQVARQQTGGRRDPRVRRDENLGNRECSATSHAWSGPRAAERHQREVAWVMALLNRSRADRSGHVRVRDCHDAGGRLEQVEPEPGRETADGVGRTLAVERQVAAEKASGVRSGPGRRSRR